MLLTTLILPMLMQVGPAPSSAPVTAVPEELYDQRRMNAEKARVEEPAPQRDPVQVCFERADGDAEAARREAQARLEAASGIDRAIAGHCLGYALGRLDRWAEASEAFDRAGDLIPVTNIGYRARVSAAAGAARLAAGEPAAALAQLDGIDTAAAPSLASSVALDRARALVALDRPEEAEYALEKVRQADPANAEAWLLSATLARRLDKLAEAQTYIERAAILLPTGPEIGLEAGVIAALTGREDAAILSWRSVVSSAPGTLAAGTATDYLEQVRGE